MGAIETGVLSTETQTVAKSSRTTAGRVLMLVENNSYPKDPRVRREAEVLRNAGYEVAVVGPAEKNQKWCETVNGIQVYRYPAPPGGNGIAGYLYEYAVSMTLMFLLSLWVWAKQGFDIIHAANPPDTLVFIAAFYKVLGKGFIFDHHDLAPEMYHARFPQGGNRLVYRVLLFCEKLSCRLADRVIATNASYKTVEMSRDGVAERRITIVRNGPLLKRMQPADPNLNLTNRADTIIAYAGIIGVQDGVDFLLRAVRHLVYDLCKTSLLCVVIGDGDALPSLKRLTQQLGIADYVYFTGWVDDADTYTNYITIADICVDPSPSNPYNDRCTTIKIMEYMAASKPIVAFDLPEHRFTAESSAIYARANDEAAFARAIAELIDDAPRRRSMGAAGRHRVEDQLAWQYSVPKLLDAYSSLYSDSKRGHLSFLGSLKLRRQVRGHSN
jgi:glycosyltransferase involved in cell wall biosynthesis